LAIKNIDYIDFEKQRGGPSAISPCWEQKPVKWMVSGGRRTVDPAAETEMRLYAVESGFVLLDLKKSE